MLRQLDALPPDASHLVLSVGGNDALGQMGILSDSVRSVADAGAVAAYPGTEEQKRFWAEPLNVDTAIFNFMKHSNSSEQTSYANGQD